MKFLKFRKLFKPRVKDKLKNSGTLNKLKRLGFDVGLKVKHGVLAVGLFLDPLAKS